MHTMQNRRYQTFESVNGTTTKRTYSSIWSCIYKHRVDYFGPIFVKNSKRTQFTSGHNKRYGAVFTCLTTRPTHLVLAGDLSTDSFILALKRFIARRGQPKVMYSNNGSNFTGA